MSLVQRFRAGAAQLGLGLCDSDMPIQPLIVGDAGAALKCSEALHGQGILVTAIRPPTVPAGTARLRITFSASHTEAHVDRLLDGLEKIFATEGTEYTEGKGENLSRAKAQRREGKNRK